MIRILLAILALAACLPALAQSPQNPVLTVRPSHPQPGMWWNPAESGRGWAIDTQGDLMTVTTFAYDNNGRMQWYVSTGPVMNSGQLWRGDLLKVDNGQPLNGNYRPAQVVGNDGQMTLEFNTRTTGFVTMPGGRRSPIERQNFGVGAPPGALLGEWAYVYSIGTSNWMDRYTLTSMIGPTSGGNGVVTDGTSRVAFEYQVSGSLAGLVVGFEFSSTGATLNQYAYYLQVEEGRGVWVAPSSGNQYGMNAYKTRVSSGVPKKVIVDDGDLAVREGKGPATQPKGVTLRELEANNPELGGIARQMWELLQQPR
jgi:hypothetical protein